jgi:hypothetical protein
MPLDSEAVTETPQNNWVCDLPDAAKTFDDPSGGNFPTSQQTPSAKHQSI